MSRANDLAEWLTIREYAAIRIMAGFAANHETAINAKPNAIAAVEWADALIAELEKKPQNCVDTPAVKG